MLSAIGKRIFLIVLFGSIVLVGFVWQPSSNIATSFVLEENFDGSSLSAQGEAIADHGLAQLAEGEGRGGSQALRVNYEGYERGSRRVVKSPRIPPAEQYELAFWVRFCEGFDFARGGKLHGLGPANSVTGGGRDYPGRLECPLDVSSRWWAANLRLSPEYVRPLR